MKTILKVLFLGVASMGSLVQAGTPDPQTVKKIETYLNGIKSYRASIQQRSDTGDSRTGKIYMLRDGKKSYGKLRIEYAPPVKDLFVVNGEECQFYDAQAQETQRLGVDDTPASFLLAKHIDLNGRLKVVDQKQDSNGDLNLKVVRSGDESGGYLVLKFSMEPFVKLNGWSLKDHQGISHDIHLDDVNIGISLDPSLFTFK